MPKKNLKFFGIIEYIYEFVRTSRMQIRKKWFNQLKNFLINIFENIIWHLFAGESHQVVKIIVTQQTDTHIVEKAYLSKSISHIKYSFFSKKGSQYSLLPAIKAGAALIRRDGRGEGVGFLLYTYIQSFIKGRVSVHNVQIFQHTCTESGGGGGIVGVVKGQEPA